LFEAKTMTSLTPDTLKRLNKILKRQGLNARQIKTKTEEIIGELDVLLETLLEEEEAKLSDSEDSSWSDQAEEGQKKLTISNSMKLKEEQFETLSIEHGA
jgi:hypothetical protein